MDRLKGKVAIVSGGAGGCGAAAVRLFAMEGAAVGIIDQDITRGSALAAELTALGQNVVFASANVARKSEVEAAVALVSAALGPVTVLFNHAGTIVIKPFLQTEEADWDYLFDVNVKSMYLMTRAVLPQMIAAGGGSIVCTSSISAVYATPMEVLYDATKGACHMFSRAIAVEFRSQGIRCNAICPGFIETPHGVREVKELTALGVDVSEAAIKAAQGRLGQPQDIARAALYLASNDSDFVTGTHLFVDGGFSAV
jgi:NAD(P)-dependent dehydrogenase (short-subunit alcohol dehydrogenase family)